MPDTRTHYVPSFTTIDPLGRQRAICGEFIWPEQHRIDPQELGCWGCRMWMESLHLIGPETTDEARTA
jgi:hypothetical protein